MLLSHLSVLEASGNIATRYCGRLFSRLGAQVDRIASGDDRGIGYAGEAGRAYGRWLDQGKALLAPGAASGGRYDLVIGGQDKAGVDAARKAAEGLPGSPVVLELSWFDPDGPYGDWQGSDEVILALNGLAFGFGDPVGPPMLSQGHAMSVVGGVTGFNAALAALLAQVDRRPATVSVSIHEASMCFAETGAIAAEVHGLRSSRLGVNRYPPSFPCGSYETADGWLGVTALTPAQWQALCRMIGRPDLVSDPNYATSPQRLAATLELNQILRPALKTRTTAEWVALGIAARVPTAPMPTPAGLPDEPHWAGRGSFAPIGPGDALGPDLPFRFIQDGIKRPPWTPGAWEGPLSGLKVVDFGMGWAGPLAGRTLGDLGADVIKIESFSHMDWWRGWEAGDADPAARESKLNFVAVNRNKRGVSFDLTQPDGLAAAKALIAGADVVLENYAEGVMQKLGLDSAALRAIRPGLVLLSMPAFGAGGPLSGLRAYGSTVEQSSGLPFMNGEAAWAPCLQHVAFGDPVAGLFGAAAILAALASRDRLGGSAIDCSQVECLFQLGADGLIAAQVLPDLPRTGRARARLALCDVVAAAGEDEWLAVAAKPSELRALAGVLGVAEDADLKSALAEWASVRTPMDGAIGLQAAGVTAAPVTPSSGLCQDPHLVATGFWPRMQRAYVGEHSIGHAPFRLDGQRVVLRRTAPLLGEHTDEVLAELAAEVT